MGRACRSERPRATQATEPGTTPSCLAPPAPLIEPSRPGKTELGSLTALPPGGKPGGQLAPSAREENDCHCLEPQAQGSSVADLHSSTDPKSEFTNVSPCPGPLPPARRCSRKGPICKVPCPLPVDEKESGTDLPEGQARFSEGRIRLRTGAYSLCKRQSATSIGTQVWRREQPSAENAALPNRAREKA